MMSDRPTLTIAYSTLPARLKGIKYPEHRDDREILVLVQNVDESSYVFTAKDTKLVELKNKGVAKSRNAALDRASGEFLLFGDDDMEFIESGVDEAVAYFRENPDCAIILTQAIDDSGALRKSYPSKLTPLKLTNSAKAATYEMLVRVDVLKDKGIRFDENFGAGAENYLGDEYILIADALRAGLKGVHLPVKLAIHPKDSSGSKWGSENDLAARAKVFKRVFGWRAPLYRAAFLVRTNNPWPGISKALRFIFSK